MSEIRKITLQFPSLRAFLSEYGERISADGILLRGVRPPEVGSRVDIEVVVSEGMRLLRARGETLWSESAGQGRQGAAAVRFEELDDAGRIVIDRILEQRRRDGGELFDLDEVPGPREARLRDMTVPAAPEPLTVPREPPGDTIFDLAAPPAVEEGELLTTAGEAEGPSAPAVASPPEPEPSPVRLSPPPVALLADDEPVPFDLDLRSAAGAGGAGGETTVEEGELEPVAAQDLKDLFGADEPPPAATAEEPTEAFPESFLHEVEAELGAADGPPAGVGEQPSDGYTETGPGEPKVDLEEELDQTEPETLDLPLVEPWVTADEAGIAADRNEIEPGPDLQPPLAGPPVAGGLSASGEAESEDPEVPETQPELRPEATIESPAPEAVAAAVETRPEPTTMATADEVPQVGGPEEQPVPREEAALGEGVDSEDETPSEAEAAGEVAEDDVAGEASASPTAVDAAERAGVSFKVAEAFDTAYGAETVEIPVVEDRPKSTTAAALPSMVESPVPGQKAVDESAPPAPAPPMDDNLLSIPDLTQEPAASSTGPVGESPAALQSLRGAASRSHRFGTWLLIVLLVGALAIAGYSLYDMIRQETEPPAPVPPRAVEQPGPPPSALPTAAEVTEEVAAEPPPVAAEEPAAAAIEPPALATEEPAAAAIEPPAPATEEPAAVAIESPAPAIEEPLPTAIEPAALLTRLERITWTETPRETALALLGDAAIRQDQVELLPLGGELPRLVIKIAGVARPFQPATLEVGTAHVIRVRTGLHSGGVLHVVVDLAAPGVVLRQSSHQGPRLEVRLGPE